MMFGARESSASADLYAPITVTGTFNGSGHKIWVNGTEAVQSGGTWTADNVRLNEGGTASVQARAIPNTDNGGNGTGGGGTPTNADLGNPASTAAKDAETEEDKPAVVLKKSYTKFLNDPLYQPHNGYVKTFDEVVRRDYDRPEVRPFSCTAPKSTCWNHTIVRHYEHASSNSMALHHRSIGTAHSRRFGSGLRHRLG
jgi:hypothetical protein